MDQNKLIDLAWKARENAYVPYSHFKVGACIALKDGTFVQGCNIENAAYGSTIVAITSTLPSSNSAILSTTIATL